MKRVFQQTQHAHRYRVDRIKGVLWAARAALGVFPAALAAVRAEVTTADLVGSSVALTNVLTPLGADCNALHATPAALSTLFILVLAKVQFFGSLFCYEH